MNHRIFTKESQKHIKSILKNNLLLNDFVKFSDKIKKSSFLNDTIKIINNTCDTKNNFTHTQYKNYKPSSKLKTPLMYELFKNAYNEDVLRLITEKLNATQKKNLVDIIKKNNIDEFISFSNRYQHLFQYQNIDNYIQTYPNNKTSITYLSMNAYGPISDLLYNNPFMPIDVQYDAEYHTLDYNKYASSDGSVIHLYTYSHKKHDIDIDLLFNIIKIMQKISKSNDPVKLIIFNSDKQKKINKYKTECNCKHLAPINVNTGSTVKLQYIKIWRNEELYKVLIHELVHFFSIDMDFYRQQVEHCDKKIKKIFNITDDSVDFLNESYTEIIALFIHTSYISYISKIDLFLLLWLEVSFTMLQISKIISYYDLQNSKCVIKNAPDCNQNSISQSTSVLSYYIIKGCVLYNMPTILTFVDKNVIFDEREMEYLDIVKKSIENNKFHNEINVRIKNLSNYKYMLDTLRMTCLQIA